MLYNDRVEIVSNMAMLAGYTCLIELDSYNNLDDRQNKNLDHFMHDCSTNILLPKLSRYNHLVIHYENIIDQRVTFKLGK